MRRFALSLLLTLLFARAATAQELDDAQVSARLAQLETSFDRGEAYANLWFNGWLGIFTASALGSGIASVASDGDEAAAWRISALRSGPGVLSVLLAPCPAAEAPSMLRKLPDATPEDRAKKLHMAEDQLHRAAKSERLSRSWLAHSTMLVSAGFSLWVWRGYHKPGAAALSFATGVAATEAKIFTAPTRAIDDEQAIDEGRVIAPDTSLGHQLLQGFTIVPTPNGFVLAGNF